MNTPMAEIEIEAPAGRPGTRNYLRVWEFTTNTRWPENLIVYDIEQELEWASDGKLIEDESKIAARITITDAGLSVVVQATGYEHRISEITAQTWADSAAGVAIKEGIQGITNLTCQLSGLTPTT